MEIFQVFPMSPMPSPSEVSCTASAGELPPPSNPCGRCRTEQDRGRRQCQTENGGIRKKSLLCNHHCP